MSVLKDSLVVFTEGARVNFNMYGFAATVMGYFVGKEPHFATPIFETPQDKEDFANKIMAGIAAGEIKEFVIVTEAWTAKVEDGQEGKVVEHLRKHGSLETWPGRGEIVQVLYCSPTEEIDYTADIERGIMGATLGPWKETRRAVRYDIRDMTARFQGLFVKAKAGQN